MRALVLHGLDGPRSASVEDVDTPIPGPGEVLVSLQAAALNHRELWITRGQYPGMVATPFTLGCDGAGFIEAVGPGVDARRVGQAVVLYPGLRWGPDPRFPDAGFGLLGMPGPGTVAEKINVPADSALPLPTHLSFPLAAALPLGGLTAWRGLFVKGALQAGEKVLITGVGGGVATFALQFAVQAGASVYVTSGSDDSLQKASKLGAMAGFNYKAESWRKALSKASGGIDLVFDGAPAASYPGYGRALNPGARVIVYGSTGGLQFPVNAPELFLKNVQIIGTNVGNLEEFQAMCGFMQQHELEPVIDHTFTLESSPAALQYLQDGHQFGKVIISI